MSDTGLITAAERPLTAAMTALITQIGLATAVLDPPDTSTAVFSDGLGGPVPSQAGHRSRSRPHTLSEDETDDDEIGGEIVEDTDGETEDLVGQWDPAYDASIKLAKC